MVLLALQFLNSWQKQGQMQTTSYRQVSTPIKVITAVVCPVDQRCNRVLSHQRKGQPPLDLCQEPQRSLPLDQPQNRVEVSGAVNRGQLVKQQPRPCRHRFCCPREGTPSTRHHAILAPRPSRQRLKFPLRQTSRWRFCCCLVWGLHSGFFLFCAEWLGRDVACWLAQVLEMR